MIWLLFLDVPPLKKKSLVRCSNITEMMTTVSLQIVGIIEPIIQHADWFFPGGEERKHKRKGICFGLYGWGFFIRLNVLYLSSLRRN